MKKFYKALWNVLMFPMLYFFFLLVLSGIVVNLFTFNDEFTYWVIALSGIIALSTYFLPFMKNQGKLWKECRFRKISITNISLALSIAIGLSAAICGYIAKMLTDLNTYIAISNEIASSISNINHFIPLILIIPIVEEIIFRGLVLTRLKNNTKWIVSIILQTLIYVSFTKVIVYDPILTSDPVIFYTFAIVLGLVFLWTDSIWTSIIVSMGCKLMSTFVFPFLIWKTYKFTTAYIILGFAFMVFPIMFLYGKHRLFKEGRIQSL